MNRPEIIPEGLKHILTKVNQIEDLISIRSIVNVLPDSRLALNHLPQGEIL